MGSSSNLSGRLVDFEREGGTVASSSSFFFSKTSSFPVSCRGDLTAAGDWTVLARERWLGGECDEGSYLANDFEDKGEGLFLVELVDTVRDMAVSEAASKLRSWIDVVYNRACR